MKRLAKGLSKGLVLLSLHVAPGLVTAGAVTLGSWYFGALAPIASDSRLAAWGLGVVLVRAIAALGAISAGSFAVSGGLVGAWLATDGRRARRFHGLAALGATSMIGGGFIVIGPLVGFGIAHSLGVVGAVALLAGLSLRSTWSLRRLGPQAPAQPQLREGAADDARGAGAGAFYSYGRSMARRQPDTEVP